MKLWLKGKRDDMRKESVVKPSIHFRQGDVFIEKVEAAPDPKPSLKC